MGVGSTGCSPVGMPPTDKLGACPAVRGGGGRGGADVGTGVDIRDCGGLEATLVLAPVASAYAWAPGVILEMGAGGASAGDDDRAVGDSPFGATAPFTSPVEATLDSWCGRGGSTNPAPGGRPGGMAGLDIERVNAASLPSRDGGGGGL